MFDSGLFMAALHCLETEEKRKNALKEFYRVLKPGAEALISVWLSEDSRFEGKDSEVYMSWMKEGKSIMRYYYLYNQKELTKLLESAGFEVLHVYESKPNDRFSKKNWIMKIRK